ncbi:helix-turn-helix domain-containing protein [Pseudonocardia benzenivorans]|uniref:Helix-turn-helix domain-containing protein n=1 Tax=Pseudonocardia benzenivorans TaxID=228005 RepID=A0ABW3VTR0_9PSEU
MTGGQAGPLGGGGANARQGRVANPRGTVSERLNYLFQNIRSIEDKPYSAAQVARWIEDNGGEISAVYILKILNGERNEPSQRYLKDLARFFGVSPAFFWDDEPAGLDVGVLRERIVLRDGHLRAMMLRAARLSPGSRQAVSVVIEALLKAEGKSD